MARPSRASLLFVIVLAGCQAAGSSGPPPSTLPSIVASPSTPASTPATATEGPPSPSPVAACPDGPLSVDAFLAADARCYVDEDVAIVGWWDGRRTDDPAREANLDHMLRGSMPFGALNERVEDFLFVDEQAVAAAGGWPGGVHWATVTGRRGEPAGRSCHVDQGPDLPVRHCPSYLVATQLVESEPPASALAGCSTMVVDEAGWVDAEAFTAYPPACFGSRESTVRGWLDVRFLITGWELPWGITPGWLWVPIGPWTVVAPSSNPETSSALVVYSDPARGVDLRQANRWVVLTGHYGDPKAETCRVEYANGYDAARDGPRVPDSFARRLCELHFVATSVRDEAP